MGGEDQLYIPYMDGRVVSLLLHLAPEDVEPLREQIVRQLREKIVRGELEPGAALPGHRRLARQHRVAPSTVEAAYRQLIDEGMVDGADGERVRVATLDHDHRRELVERIQLEHLLARELGRRELEMARDVQRRLLPPSEVAGRGWEVAARCVPARVVAGDFYDVVRHDDGSVDVAVADVAGKGFAASLIMASVKAMLPFVTAEPTAAEALTHLNRRLAPELGRGEFVALSLARYRPAAGVVELANGGAPDPYLLRPGLAPRPLPVPGPRLPLGVRAEVAYASRTSELGDGEALLLLTDGLPEARGPDGEPLGYEALEAMVGREPGAGTTPAERLAGLFDAVHECTGRLPEDDWTAALLVPRPVTGGQA